MFTNVPLDETIKICSDALYYQSDFQPLIPKDVFVELVKSATSSAEFSFNNAMCKQTDGIIMGSPFGLALTTTVVGYFSMKKSCFGWKVHTDINHKHYIENNLVCIAHNVPNHNVFVVYVGENLLTIN